MSPDRRSSLERIREAAEQIARNRPLSVPRDDAGQRSLVQELHIHQIELEIQNEELLAAQYALEKARYKYSDLFNNAPVGYLILDPAGFILEANQTFADMAGRPLDRLVKTPFGNWLTPSARRLFLGQFKAFFNAPEKKRLDLQLDGGGEARGYIAAYGCREADATVTGRPTGGHAHDRIRVVVVDVSGQRVAETALATAYAGLSLRHQLAGIVIDMDGDAMFPAIVQRLCEHLGCRYGYIGVLDEDDNLVCPALSASLFPHRKSGQGRLVFTRADWQAMWGRMLAEKRTIVKPNGLAIPHTDEHLVNALAVPIISRDRMFGQIVAAGKENGFSDDDRQLLESIADWIAPVLSARMQRDVQRSRREKIENDLRQAQRMESIGVLAGGIAHDFNNILSPIIGYTELMIEDAPAASVFGRNLREVAKAAHRAKDLVGQLLAYSRKQMLDVQTIDLNRTIGGMAKMVQRLVREDIAVDYALAGDLGSIRADPSQIDQILLNLVANAQDAIPDAGGLTIATANRQVHVPTQQYHFVIKPGDYVEISVTDTGTGITPDVMPYIFEPFFTTKERGRGTGMGLATCYGIVKQHEGYIWAESATGRGTRMVVWFPLASDTGADRAAAGPLNGALPQARGETIMVVEDDPAVRKMAAMALERLGYTVIEVDSPQSCLAGFASGNTPIDLLLADVVMPGGSGKDLYSALKRDRPGLKVLFMSGYTDSVLSGRGVAANGMHFLGKPFTISEIAAKVREVLDSA